MIEHLVFFKCKPELGKEGINKIINMFRNFKGVIPGLVEVEIGENVTEETQYAHGYTLGLRMKFENQSDLRNYLLHPEHVKVSQFVLSSLEDVVVCDFCC